VIKTGKTILLKHIRRIPFWASLLALLLVSIDFGFDQTESTQKIFIGYYRITFLICLFSLIVRYFDPKWRPPKKVWPFDLLLLAFLVMLLTNFKGWPEFAAWSRNLFTYTAIGLVFIREFSALKFDFRKQVLNPAQIFILSFFAIIVAGTLLLLLPNATHTGIGLTDALFTSTSAVCVTGLTVVDTGTYFTFFGQVVILLLIQLGGLGIMTFTSYFSYFFRGESSYENNLMLREITSTEKIAEVFGTLKKIILITFLVEVTGAILIYGTLDNNLIPTFTRRVFFSVFHSVSGFCNAGFSTLPQSLFTEGFRFNYPLHLAIAFLFILGGLGFPIVFNFIRYLRHIVVNRLHPFNRRKRSVHLPWVININTRIVIITTGVLLIAGTLLFLVFENSNSLSEHQGFGKIVTAFFSAATPRTAGFNTVDTSAIGFSAIVLTFFLMWVGASPGSTGGGIKTSTLAIMVMNIVSLARGKDRIEIFRKEISNHSVRRAFAIIALSFLVISVSAFLIASVDPGKKISDILFESLSAFSTVGLSRGITGDLNASSKIILIFTMFIGRVSLLTILIALTRKIKNLNYRYPGEEILIN
jgi:trk system potassium uptake protein